MQFILTFLLTEVIKKLELVMKNDEGLLLGLTDLNFSRWSSTEKKNKNLDIVQKATTWKNWEVRSHWTPVGSSHWFKRIETKSFVSKKENLLPAVLHNKKFWRKFFRMNKIILDEKILQKKMKNIRNRKYVR